VGRYHDTFKRVDGRWEFSVKELITTLAGVFHTAQHQILSTLKQSKTEGDKVFESIDKMFVKWQRNLPF